MQNISIEEVKERLDNGESITLIDVREPYEHTEFNIGGILYPLGKIQSMIVDELEAFKEQEVVVYCRSGNRSGQACLILETAGFTNIVNVSGGMMAWQDRIAR